MQEYLVTTSNANPFTTNWFDAENNWQTGVNMIVYNILSNKYTSDGIFWINIEEDNL